jgi:hypothetical protein
MMMFCRLAAVLLRVRQRKHKEDFFLHNAFRQMLNMTEVTREEWDEAAKPHVSLRPGSESRTTTYLKPTRMPRGYTGSV